MRYDVSVIGLFILDILGRPVSRDTGAGQRGVHRGDTIDRCRHSRRHSRRHRQARPEKVSPLALSATTRRGTLSLLRSRSSASIPRPCSAWRAYRPRPQSSMCVPMVKGRRCMCAAPPIISMFRLRCTARCSMPPSFISAERGCCANSTATRAASCLPRRKSAAPP